MDTIVLAFAAIWGVLLFIIAYTPVETGNIGIVFRFGKLRRILQPGFNLVIPFIDRVERHSTQTHQDELPAESESIDRVSDVPPVGMKAPFRIAHKGMEEAEFYVKRNYEQDENPFDNTLPWDMLTKVRFSQLPQTVQEAMRADPLHFPLTSEASVINEWLLEGKERSMILNFIENVSPEEGRNREEEVRKRSEDLAARILQEYIAPTTLGHAIYMSPLFSKLIKEKMEILVGEREDSDTLKKSDKPWGIHIRDAYLKPLYAGHTINKARADAAAAVSRKQDAIREAEGKAQGTVLQSEADKMKEINKGKGEAGRIEAMATVMTNPTAMRIAELDVLETVLPQSKPIIIQGGGEAGGLLGLLAIGQQNLGNNK